MSKQTLQERFIAALIKRGEREVKRTFKYIVYSRSDVPEGSHYNKYYIGKSGSLRVGYTAQDSVPCSKHFKHKLLEEV